MGMSFFNLPAQSDEIMETGYKFPLGKKYHILQYRANIRDAPARSGKIIAVLSLNDEIEVLENTLINERINDVWGYWYKIKFGNISGYTFGGNIAVETLITDIDKNGINDSFQFRFSNKDANYSRDWDRLDSYIDVIIYINNQRINTDMLDRYWFSSLDPKLPEKDIDYIKGGYEHFFDDCRFIKNDDYVLIELERWGKDNYIWKTIYKVDKYGKIEFYEWQDVYPEYYDHDNGRWIFRILDRVTINGEWYSDFRKENGENEMIKITQ